MQRIADCPLHTADHQPDAICTYVYYWAIYSVTRSEGQYRTSQHSPGWSQSA
jgi:hypothetical protein